MKAATTYTFPIGAHDVQGTTQQPKALVAFRDGNVTGFETKLRAQLLFFAGMLFSILIISLDSLTIWTMTKHTGTAGTSLSIVNNENTWGIGVAIFMLVCDFLTFITQTIDQFYFHYTVWPLTALSWFGHLNGTGLSSAILGMYMYYPFGSIAERDEKLTVVVSNLAAHALFVSVYFAIALEYIVRTLRSDKK